MSAGDTKSTPGGASSRPSGVPETTKSIVLTGFGGYDKLEIRAMPSPTQPGPDEVLIHVRASGLNFADCSMREGLYDRLPKTPAVVGMEGSGDVISVGHAVDNFKAGDRVLFLRGLGAWTEYVLVGAVQCFHMPANMSYEEGAALPVNYITAYHILFNLGGLSKGKSVLVHMAAGGVGFAAVQLCKTVPDVIVYGTASAVKHEAIQKNGVDHPIDYKNQDYVTEIHKIDPEGVDIVMDPLAGSDSEKGFNLLKPFGKIVHFGMANAVTGTTKNYWTLMKAYFGMKSYNVLDMVKSNRAVCGYHLGHLEGKHAVVKPAVEAIIALYKEGKIKPQIDSVWAYEDVGLAMARIHDRVNVGKIVLSPQKEPQHKT